MLRILKGVFILLVLINPYQLKAQITGIKIIGDPCNNYTLDLQATGTSSSPYFFWDFDDPLSGVNDTVTIFGNSATPFPTHTFTAAGVYNVCVTFQEPGFPVTTVCRSISIGLCCNGVIFTNDSCVQNNIPFSIITDATIVSVTWNFGDPASGTNNVSNDLTPVHLFSSTGSFNVTANVTAACGNFQINYPLQIVSCSTNCTGTILSNDTCLQNGTRFQIVSNNTINSVVWNFSDPASGTNNTSSLVAPTHLFSSTGIFSIRAIVNFDCGVDTISKEITIIDCANALEPCQLFVPNVFSPNKDGLNDVFYPVTKCAISDYECMVFNRWGGLVYKTLNPNDKWDGKHNGLDCTDGVYFYIITYQFPLQQTKKIYGTVTLLR